MAACALTSARIRDGAYAGHISDDLQRPESSSEIFFTAACESLDIDSAKTGTIDYIRSCALLALACIQYGQSVDVQQYLGKAFTVAAMHKFYDEKYWPTNLDESQKEMYRRVYWCVYAGCLFGYRMELLSAISRSPLLRSLSERDQHRQHVPSSSDPSRTAYELACWVEFCSRLVPSSRARGQQGSSDEVQARRPTRH